MKVNTQSIATLGIDSAMVKTKADRLKAAREAAGFESAADACRAFGWREPAYRHHENGTRGFGADAAKKYGKAFKVRPSYLLGMDNDQGVPVPGVGSDAFMVNAYVEAGAWRTADGWNDEKTFIVEGMPSPFGEKDRFGMMVEGNSMNEFYEPGTALDCVSTFANGIEPQHGDHVIVENRRSDGLREMTVKEFQLRDGKMLLVPRSTKPGYETLEYHGPDEDHDDDSDVRVVAFVVGAYPPRVLDLLHRMGKIRYPNR